MNERLREELLEKRKELEWKNNLRSLEIINWIDGLLKRLEEPAAPAPKEVIVDLPEEKPAEEKKLAKKKITFKKK